MDNSVVWSTDKEGDDYSNFRRYESIEEARKDGMKIHILSDRKTIQDDICGCVREVLTGNNELKFYVDVETLRRS